MELTNAKVHNIDLENSAFNLLLTFSNHHQAVLYCRVEDEKVKAYNIGIMDTCPCCMKPNCASLFAKRHELLKEAQNFTEFPQELIPAGVLVNN